MNNMNVVWTAVVTVVLGLASFVSAWQNDMTWTLALGLSAVASALLASREK
jgi:hypothetical protein